MLEKLTNNTINNDHGCFIIAYLIEQLYSSQDEKLVLPLSFRHNILTYSFSHSRSLINTINSFLPAGSKTYLTNWLTKNAENEIPFPEGLIKVVFDNEQVIGKNYKAKVSGNLVKSSVITSKACIKISDSDIQGFADMKPKYWLFKTNNDVSLIMESLNEHQNIFRETRNAFIKERVQLLEREQNIKPLTKKCTDEADKLVERKKESYSEKICIECGEANDLTYRLCTSCNGKLTNNNSIILNLDKLSKYTDPYQSFQFSPSSSNMQVIVGEPDMISPSGYENIVSNLRNIGVRAGIDKYVPNGKRKWLILENDGAIYTIIIKLIQNVLSCPKCRLSTNGKENVVDHQLFCCTMLSWKGSLIGLFCSQDYCILK